MSPSGESINFGPDGSDYEEFVRLSNLNRDIEDAFKKYDSLTEFVAILSKSGDDFDVRVDMVLGGKLLTRVDGQNQYNDIALVQSANEDSKDTTLVVRDECIKISRAKISSVFNPDSKLGDEEVKALESWVGRARWSREDGLRLAQDWRQSHSVPQE